MKQAPPLQGARWRNGKFDGSQIGPLTLGPIRRIRAIEQRRQRAVCVRMKSAAGSDF
jgi:hypothetical protein